MQKRKEKHEAAAKYVEIKDYIGIMRKDGRIAAVSDEKMKYFNDFRARMGKDPELSEICDREQKKFDEKQKEEREERRARMIEKQKREDLGQSGSSRQSGD